MPTITKPKTKLIQTRLDADLVNQVNIVLGEIGLGINDAIKIFLKKVANEQSIPFALTAKKPSTTWHTSTAPLREPTPEEAKVIEEFVKNPQLLPAEESAKFLEELKMSL
jgi:addiction module RelB/DinJ family antitoxin